MLTEAPITKDLIKQYLPECPAILEAGAHIGRDTIKMIKTWPCATVYAFEPVAALFTQLVERTANYPSITCYPLALADREGNQTLYVSSGASTAASSLLEPQTYKIERPEVTFEPTVIQTTTLDLWADKERISRIDLMWLDMQGAELLALKSGMAVLKSVKALVTEVNLTQRFKNVPSYEEVVSWLSSQGLTLIQQDIPKHNKVNLLFTRYT
jgi:FkbM family methyltransferase